MNLADGQLVLGFVFILIAAAIIILALRMKESTKATFKILGFEFGLEAEGSREHGVTQSRIEALINKHNADFVKAIANRDPRFLWATSTPDAYLSQVEKNYDAAIAGMESVSAVSVEIRDIAFLSIERPDPATAIVRTDEVWEYVFSDGRRVKNSVPNIYTVKNIEGRWLIHAVEILAPSQ